MENQWHTISFATTFTSSPVIFSQIQTMSEGGKSYLQTRQDAIRSSGFQLALEPEQAVTTQHVPEQIGYFAIEAGRSTWNGMAFEANTTGLGVTDQFDDISFEGSYSDTPGFLSSLTTYIGQDNSHVRYTSLHGEGVQLKIGEDTTYDTEVTHSEESVAYLTIDGEGTLTAITPQLEIGEVGRIVNLTHEPQTIRLERNYANPVVFAQSATEIDPDPVAVRITNVQSDRFTIYIAEPSNLDGKHNSAETVTYLVLETGTHHIVNGAQLEVGTVITDSTVGIQVANATELVDFSRSFNATPAVFSQIQTDAGEAYLQTRHLSVSPTSVELALEQEESITDQHPMAETVGYLAIESGTGIWTGLPFEVLNTPAVVTDQLTLIHFEGFYLSPPRLLSSLTTYHGSDNAHLRYANLDKSGVRFKIGEDTTQDTEIFHGNAESVAYLAIAGDGIITAVLPTTAPMVDALVRNGGAVQYNRLDTVSIIFDQHVIVDGDGLMLRNASTDGTTVDLSGYQFNYDSATSAATWNLIDVAGITPAWYTLTLEADCATGMHGLALDGDRNGNGGDDYGYSFLVAKAGDTDLDSDVDFTDTKNLILRFDPIGINSGNNWSMGNFDGDTDIDTIDFDTMAINFTTEDYATYPTNVLATSDLKDFHLLHIHHPSPVAPTIQLATEDATVQATATDRAFADTGLTESLLLLDDERLRTALRRTLRQAPAADNTG